MIEKFTLASLAQIDQGRIREAFEQAMRRCEFDCRDRPAIEDARKVTLTVELKPRSASGDLESVDVKFAIKDAIPTRRSDVYNMRAVRGGLVYNEMSSEDVRQMTIDEPQPKPAPAKEASDAS